MSSIPLLMPRPNRFGTFAGVFVPCLLMSTGVILFMRSGFVVGQAGLFGALLLLILVKAITLTTALSVGAVSTNMQVRGGGAYYLISRVVGPEFGGGIGIALFLAQAMAVPFYVLGFTEALVGLVPTLEPHYPLVAFSAAVAVLAVTYLGAAWALRLQVVIFAVLMVSLFLVWGGLVPRCSGAVLYENWTGVYGPINPAAPASGHFTFWRLFVLFFPAATGIMVGINMSGDLDQPARSIPRGTLAAIAAGAVIYLVHMLLSGASQAREDLLERSCSTVAQHALFNGTGFVAVAMLGAALSGAIGSCLAAPRVLQAVARDRILIRLRPFAEGTFRGDEPRAALLLTGLITVVVLACATVGYRQDALNAVAAVITQVFLYTYGMLNIAAFAEAIGENPSFRPRFRFFHWTTAFAGAIGCIVVAFVINPWQAAAAFIVLAALVLYMRLRELDVAFGDARRGLVYKAVRNNLVRLAGMKENPRNWRPTSLVFSGNPESREALVSFAVWMEAGRGIVFLANIIEGELIECGARRRQAVEHLRDFCRKRGIQAFPVVAVDKDLEHGMATLLQAVNVGPVRPNLAVFGWSGHIGRVETVASQFRVAQAMGMSLVVLRPSVRPVERERKRIDIWWRGMKNGGLMVLLAHLLTQNWEWNRAEVRLLRLLENDSGKAAAQHALEQLIRAARIDAIPKVLVRSRPFVDVIRQESGDADCVFLGFENPGIGHETEWYQRYEPLLCDVPTMILVCSTGAVDVTV